MDGGLELEVKTAHTHLSWLPYLDRSLGEKAHVSPRVKHEPKSVKQANTCKHQILYHGCIRCIYTSGVSGSSDLNTVFCWGQNPVTPIKQLCLPKEDTSKALLPRNQYSEGDEHYQGTSPLVWKMFSFACRGFAFSLRFFIISHHLAFLTVLNSPMLTRDPSSRLISTYLYNYARNLWSFDVLCIFSKCLRTSCLFWGWEGMETSEQKEGEPMATALNQPPSGVNHWSKLDERRIYSKNQHGIWIHRPYSPSWT